MMRSLFSGVSGLKSHQTRMDVIGNNIANVNTTGFKSSRTTFADTLSQTLTGASAPQDNPTRRHEPEADRPRHGRREHRYAFTDGSVQSTGKNTDLCLSGNGLFVVKQGNQTYYTRDGAFEFDADYNYVLPSSGYKVMGWVAADATGKSALQTNATPTAINLSNLQSMGATASTILTYTNNLNSAVPTITSISGGSNGTASTTNPILLNLSDGTTATETEGTYAKGESLPVTTTVTIYDSLGNSHSLPVYFTKTGADNTGSTWRVSINADSTLKTKEITESDGSTTTYTMSPVTLKFKTDGSYDSGSGTPVLTLSNGAKDQQQVTGPHWQTAIKGTGDGSRHAFERLGRQLGHHHRYLHERHQAGQKRRSPSRSSRMLPASRRRATASIRSRTTPARRTSRRPRISASRSRRPRLRCPMSISRTSSPT
jgi:flagellar hook protein FlgE